MCAFVCVCGGWVFVCVCVCVDVWMRGCVCVCVYELPFCPCAVPSCTFNQLTAFVKHNMNVVTPLEPTETSVSYILIPTISNNNIAEVKIYNFQAMLASFNLYMSKTVRTKSSSKNA
jgi:hypothetical protein